MNKWVKKSLGQMAQLSKEIWKPGDGDFPYIGLEHIEEEKLRLSGIGNSTSINSNKFFFDKDTFLFGKLRPYFRKVVQPKFCGVCSTDIWVVKAKPNCDLDYLFYLFASQDFIDLAYSGSSGTRMPRADWDFMKDTNWFFPKDISEQKAIAGVLSSLDDKIDLLHRQNETLEALAQTLFRQWFIEEIEDDREEIKLCSIAHHLKENIKPYQSPDEFFFHYSIPAYDNGKNPVREHGSDIRSNKYLYF